MKRQGFSFQGTASYIAPPELQEIVSVAYDLERPLIKTYTKLCIVSLCDSLSVDIRFRRATGVLEGRSSCGAELTPPLAVSLSRSIFFTSRWGVSRRITTP
jgi:hypothetical protein